MIKAQLSDRETIVNILSSSFDENKSVNYIVPQTASRKKRLRALMEYSFDYCRLFGEVYLSEDRNACALVVLPDQKKASMKSILLDVKLILSCVGINNINKALTREKSINAVHPKEDFYYLWFVGVDPAQQGRGVGSKLLNEILQRSRELRRPVYLETSTKRNLPWYTKHGFKTFAELDFGYTLYCMKHE